MPFRLTTCGLPVALSAMVTAAVRLPAAEGVKSTLIVHFALAATEAPQVFACVKSAEFTPVTARLVMFRVALPVLVRTTAWGELAVLTDWLPKARLEGESRTQGMVVPVPVRLALCGPPGALSVTVTDA